MKKLAAIQEKTQSKIETNTKKIITQTRSIQETKTKMTKVTNVQQKHSNVKKYAWCQRKVIEEPQYFDINTICSSSMSSVTTTTSSSSSSSSSSLSRSTGTSALSPSSQTCQLCYQQNPSCSGGQSAGISVISFSVDTQGEADDLVQQLFDDNLIADVNFLSAMVNRKFSLYG
jgi:hypothetical protein